MSTGRLHIEGRLNEGQLLQRKHKDENEAKQNKRKDMCDHILHTYYIVLMNYPIIDKHKKERSLLDNKQFDVCTAHSTA